MNLERKLIASQVNRDKKRTAIKAWNDAWRDAHIEKAFRDRGLAVPEGLNAGKPDKLIRHRNRDEAGNKVDGYTWHKL